MSDAGNSHDNEKLGLMAGFGVALTAYLGWSAGWDAALHHYRSMAFGLLLATFAGLYTGLVVRQMVRREQDRAVAAERDMERKVAQIHQAATEAADDMAKQLSDAIDEIQDSRSHEKLMEAGVHEAINQITGGDRPPTAEEVPAIQDKFHELVTDHYLRLEILPGGMSVEVSEQPFGLAGAEAQATETATTTTTTGDAMDAVKPIKSKSQKRREAAMKQPTQKG
jgi:hypothetical protein